MFTGIIEEIGKINSLSSNGNSGVIDIKAKKVLEKTRIGDSIAVNGVCLTVTKLKTDGFRADVMPETINRSNLLFLESGSFVNLERAMPVDGRFGGHIVSGHIDGTGMIDEIYRDENAIRINIKAKKSICNLIVEKGSITIDGISLTVASADENSFQVSIIPHTGEETTLTKRNIGDYVNLETDIVGKYVQKLLLMSSEKQEDEEGKLTIEYLKEMGF